MGGTTIRCFALSVVLAAVLPLLYTLSYAPVCYCWKTVDSAGDWEFIGPQSPYMASPCRRIPGYQPVLWLIDETWLRQPLLFWADFWGVRHDMLLVPMPLIY